MDSLYEQAGVDGIAGWMKLSAAEQRKKGGKKIGMAANDVRSFTVALRKLDENAMGGPLGKGALSIVGEKGPEFFIPKSRGTVIPSDVSQTASILAMGAGGGGGGGSTTNVSINAPTNSNTTAVSNTTENVMGASDPYVGVAGNFG